MKGREILLLRVLLAASVASGAAVVAGSFAGRAAETRARIADYRSRIDRLSGVRLDEREARSRLEAATRLVAEAEGRRTASAAQSIPALGEEAMATLVARGAAVGKYLLAVGTPGSLGLLEIHLKCGAAGLLSFLERASEEGKWSIPYLSLASTGSGDELEVVLKIGP